MKKLIKSITQKLIILGIPLLFLSCGSASGNDAFNSDHFYFEGLRFLEEKNYEAAKEKFQLCFENGSYYCARKSGEQLTKIGGVLEREQNCRKLYKKFPDEDSLLVVVKEFSDNKEYAEVLKLTENLNLAESNNQLIFLRLEAMFQKESGAVYNDVEEWFTSRLISQEHIKFYTKYLKASRFVNFSGTVDSVNSEESENPVNPEESKKEKFLSRFSSDFLNLVEFRVLVYKSSYKTAYTKISSISENYLEKESVLSHLGKTCLYGSTDYVNNARYFERLAGKFSHYGSKFYAYFYAGRLYEKAGNNFQLAMNRFQSALENATNGKEFDNALWYLLDVSLKISTDRAIANVKKYCASWSDPEYFDDFFELLTPLLIAENKWSLFKDLYRNLDGYASDGTVAKFAYLYARALQENFISVLDKSSVQNEINQAFARALESGNEPYYKVMALYELGADESDVKKVLCARKTEINFKEDLPAQVYLLGLAENGFPEKIYPEYMDLISKDVKINLETAVRLAEFLHTLGEKQNQYYPQSLRIVSKALLKCDRNPSKEQLKMFYPQDYMNLITEYCGKYNLSEENMLALIRTESFFDSGISSSAGAVGLAQLMESTAGEVARKLHWKSFDLKNSAQNIEMGVYYLGELISRLDNVVLPAFFSYNAGIKKVRRWMENSSIELGKKSKLPLDLFLETIPYTETRGYGRKLVAASVYYGWLYYGKTVSQLVEAIMGKL